MIALGLRDRIADWISRPRFPESGAVVLTQRRVYILPTRAGFGFALVLLLTLTGSINYALSLGFILTFLLGGMAVISILHTYRNLAHLRVSAGRCLPVFAGDIAHLPVMLENAGARSRISIGVRQPDGRVRFADAAAHAVATIELQVAAKQRGYLRPGRFRLFTRFPIGLTYAWSNLDFDWACVVYPAPELPPVPLPPTAQPSGAATMHTPGDDDFAGLRTYHPGDSPRRIAWKIVARTDVVMTKQFSGGGGDELWLDWEATASLRNKELRLSRLTRWVLDADTHGLSYGLRLPDVTVAPEVGDAHRRACLRALALFELPT